MQRRLSADPAPNPTPRLLLTGFGPFPGIPVNASAMLVTELARRVTHARLPVQLHTAILPTEWKEGPATLQRHIKSFSPDVALHFGVASEATGFRIETVAENARNRLSDACGHVPRRRQISAAAPSQLLATFPVAAIETRLMQMQLPVELSADAGRYLCNAALFRSLNLTRKGRGARVAGFIHIPSALGDPEQAHGLQDMDWPRAIHGSLAIVETCLAHVRGPAGIQA